MFIYELSGCGLESSCSHLNFRFRGRSSSKEFLDIQATIKCGFTLKCNVTLQEHTVTIICLLKLQPILPQTSLLTRCKSFIRPHAVAVYDQPSTDQIRKCSVQCRFSNYGSNETKVHLAKHCIKN